MEESESRDKILNGAMELFMKYGIRSVSMDDIARQLSISKKTIYHYFSDKDDVVNQVSVQHLERMKSDFDGFKTGSKNAIEELANISTCIKKEMTEMNPSLLFDIQKYHPKTWNVWLEYKNNVILTSVVQNLEQGIGEGFFRAEIQPQVLATMRLEQVQTAFDDRVFPHSKYNLADVQVQIFEHFVYGLLTEKGRKLYEKYKQEIKETEPIAIPKNN